MKETLAKARKLGGHRCVNLHSEPPLRDMGIDLEVWIHAMETPRDELYYFQPAELLTLKLATVVDDGNSRSASNH